MIECFSCSLLSEEPAGLDHRCCDRGAWRDLALTVFSFVDGDDDIVRRGKTFVTMVAPAYACFGPLKWWTTSCAIQE